LRAVLDPGARRLGIAGVQLRREVPRGGALAGPGRAVLEVRVRGTAVERGAEHGRRVGVLVEHPLES
jgi:hypothetical protein